MIWLLAAVGIVVAVAIPWHWGKQPAHHRVQSTDDILRALTTFEVGARPGALVFVEHRASGRFLQFVMGQVSRGRGSLDFSFPDVQWSSALYGPMRDALTGAGFTVVERTGSNSQRFLDVDGLGVPRAFELVQIALPVLGLADLSGLRTHFEGPVQPADAHVYTQRLREYRDGAAHA